MNADVRTVMGDLVKTLEHPLIKLGNSEVTLASICIFVFAIALVFFCELLLRRYVVRRFLGHTHFQPSMQYAVGKIIGYLFIAIGFYVALKIVGIDLSSLAVVAGAVGVGLGFGLQ